jgi:purine-binding chemotaxis protein CheW
MSDNKNSAVAEATVRAGAGKYLTFNLDNEEFGLEILKVQEIIGIMKVTRVPRAPNFVRGVINLRGKVIPVVDLRLKFGMESKPDTERTCIIVVQINRGGSRITMGSIVDDVSEVLNINREQLEPAPSFGVSVDTEFILGMGKVAQKVVMLLDIDSVLSGAEADALGKVAEQQAA